MAYSLESTKNRHENLFVCENKKESGCIKEISMNNFQGKCQLRQVRYSRVDLFMCCHHH